jgi:deoxyribodipyrimidine photo-lyase
MVKLSVFIFRRDLRIEDNTGLNAALSHSSKVIPVFFLDPRQVSDHPYRSIPGQQFLFNTLRELDLSLKKVGSKLHLFYGKAEDLLDELLTTEPIDAVFVNRDYTPFSTARDEKLLSVCKNKERKFFACHDALLHEPKSTVKDDGNPYTIFTPFFKKNSKNPPASIQKSTELHKLTTLTNKMIRDISFLDELETPPLSDIFMQGGRKEGLSILNNKVSLLTNYNTTRDIPSLDGTSGLSAHHKFGTISIRESYWMAHKELPADNRFISELYWRDFYSCIGYFYPHVFGQAFQKKFNSLEWDDDSAKFYRWCRGETGFPIVDAGMRQLNKTGWMHNRVRMIVSSFLIKDLHIDWRWGEKYFAQRLIDYDPSVNNGGWQWSASTGCDAQPYFRIFNPWLQQEKFDPEAIYIKKWIKELEPFTPKEIHNIYKNPILKRQGYPLPMIEHAIEKKITEERYSKAAGKS